MGVIGIGKSGGGSKLNKGGYEGTAQDLKDELDAVSSGYQGKLAIEDTPAEDGYYTATESGTYTNAGSIVVDLSLGATTIIKSGATYTKVVVPIDSLDELKARTTLVKNGYIHTTNGFVASESSRSIVKNVVPGKKYQISPNNTVVLASKYYLFTSDIEGTDPVGSRVALSNSVVTIDAPEGANYLFACVSFNGNGSVIDYDIIEYYSVYDKIDQGETTLNALKFQTGNNIGINISSPNLAGKYYRIIDATKAAAARDNSGFNSHSISVEYGDVFLGSARVGSSSTGMAIFYDASGNKISHALTGDSAYHQNVEIVTPKGASEMIFVWVNDSPAALSKFNLDKEKNPSVKVLLIGSSHGMNTIGQFPILAYNSGIDVTCANAYQGSLSISQLADYCDSGDVFSGSYKKFSNGTWGVNTSYTILQMLQDEQWDFISIQRSASEDMTWTAEQDEDFNTILDFIYENCDYAPKIVFNSGFADTYTLATRSSQQADSVTIWDTANEVKDKYGIDIIPMATVLQEVRNNDTLAALGTSPNGMLSSDTQHLDQGIGWYVSGGVCFNFFLKHLGKSILTCNYFPTIADLAPFGYDAAKYTAISDPYAKEIRRIINKSMVD
tara:strand:+ start:15501 stop:17339 length:1839 start_codon:yes stop_codon:yes gene_type:complete